MKGLTAVDNPMGFHAVRLHYSADPEKDPAGPNGAAAAQWIADQRRQWPDPNDFEREFEINFFSGQGTRVYPQFTLLNHVRPLDPDRYRVVYRGWDFGWHAPVCLFAQIDRKDRLVVLKEIVGNQQDTKSFAQHVIRRSGEWFPAHAAGFEDHVDPAGQQIKSIESERSERRDTEILGGLGIHARYAYGWSRKDGRSLIHQLLVLREGERGKDGVRAEGSPALLVDDRGCPLLAQAFLGRYVYPERLDGTVDDEPDDRTHPWADVQAALRYLVIGVHTKLGVSRHQLVRSTQPSTAPPATMGYGTPRRGR